MKITKKKNWGGDGSGGGEGKKLRWGSGRGVRSGQM